jgi:hypothetical protein
VDDWHLFASRGRPLKLQSYAEGRWHTANDGGKALLSAVDGSAVASISSRGLDFASMHAYARRIGGPALQKLTFHERAIGLKALAQYFGWQFYQCLFLKQLLQ